MRKIAFTLAAAVLLRAAAAFADGVPQPANSTHDNWTAPVNQGANGDLDPRLPPVLPGEMVIRNGRPMRVWSTSGPVPVSPPAAEPTSQVTLPNGIGGIIVDGRREGVLAPSAPAAGNQ
jgi:hypothetical protein